MTKFSEIKEPQREHLFSLYFEVYKTKIQEDQELNRLGVRAPLLANIAALAVLITFIGVLVQSGKPHSGFATSLILFLTGAGLAAFVQLMLLGVASQAVIHHGTQLESFVQGKIELEQMQSWGFSKRGRIIAFLLLGLSICSFGAGIWTAFTSLTNL